LLDLLDIGGQKQLCDLDIRRKLTLLDGTKTNDMELLRDVNERECRNQG